MAITTRYQQEQLESTLSQLAYIQSPSDILKQINKSSERTNDQIAADAITTDHKP